MSTRLKTLAVTLLLLLLGISGWAARERSQRSTWVAELQRVGVHASTEQNFEGKSDSLTDLCWSVYAGECVRVLVDNEADARALLTLSRRAPARVQILTFLDLSADWFTRLQDEFPRAELVALVPKETLEPKRDMPAPSVVATDGMSS
ncbi:MAG TPA: hypothetical protein VM452_05960 [Caulifigura sp.]|jgi:hypothetical protein|nr:hypothetical protein [Caulifigura sp.]